MFKSIVRFLKRRLPEGEKTGTIGNVSVNTALPAKPERRKVANQAQRSKQSGYRIHGAFGSGGSRWHMTREACDRTQV